MKENPLLQQVNFILSVCLIGSSALWGIVSIIEAAEDVDPLAEMFISSGVIENLSIN